MGNLLWGIVIAFPLGFAAGVYRKDIYEAYLAWRVKRQVKAKS